MSNFTPLVTREYEFDGDTVKVTFSRLRRRDMLNVLPSFQALGEMEEGSPEYNAGMQSVLNDVADILPNCVKTIEGLNDTEGNPVPLDSIINEMYFMKLSALITVDLIKESGVSKNE